MHLPHLQDRNVNNAGGGPEASRKTAAARRKIGTLGTLVDKLLRAVDAPEAQPPL
jgi:SYP5 family syntaxin